MIFCMVGYSSVLPFNTWVLCKDTIVLNGKNILDFTFEVEFFKRFGIFYTTQLYFIFFSSHEVNLLR